MITEHYSHRRALIGYTENKEEENWKGYLYAVLFFVNGITSSIFFHQLFHIGMTLGMRVKSAVIATVYKKVKISQNYSIIQMDISMSISLSQTPPFYYTFASLVYFIL